MDVWTYIRGWNLRHDLQSRVHAQDLPPPDFFNNSRIITSHCRSLDQDEIDMLPICWVPYGKVLYLYIHDH